MPRKELPFYCLGVALIILLSSSAMAEIIWREGPLTFVDELTETEGRIAIGRIKVIPTLKLAGVYDDNIFLGNGYTSNPDNPDTTFNGELRRPVKSDYIFRVMPGVLLNYDLPGGRGRVNLGYEGDWAFYKNFTSQNWNNQRGVFDADYRAPGGLIVGIHNVYASGNDPYGDATQYDIGYTKQRWDNNLDVRIGWNFFNRFQVIGYYGLYKQAYDDDRDYTQDWTTNRFGIGFEMRVMPKTWAFVRYSLENQNFDRDLFDTTNWNNADNRQSIVRGGLRWDSAGKLGGELNVGWGWLRYDHQFDSAGRQYEDNNTWVAATSINYQVLARTRMTLNVRRAMIPTGAATVEYYDDTQVGINIGQDLPHRLSLVAAFLYGRNDYNTPVNPVSRSTADRKDNNYNAGLSLRYRVRDWLDASLGYRYMKKDSNDITQSFSDNQVMLSVRASY